ncbi:MAG: ATP-binding protein [Candidatus Heimdallarchaeota archaeon]|nr:MAG: ATP-binding protein [Candidatus Heimdallarchaeota archaeon]
MKPWYEIVHPHSMILSGHIRENFFLADLGNIIQESAPSDYLNPRKFFQQTLLTRGLLNIFTTIQTKLCRGEGSGIIKLQTPFGGGKTHTLISIYHYAISGVEVHNYLPKNLSPFKAEIVTIVGTNLNPVEGRHEDNIFIHTIWGDMAFQLAGVDGYKEFEANDIERISPGKEKLTKFLKQHQPFLLLFDEMAEYVAKARGISVNESNLGIQTLIFLQELTEAIASLPRGLLVITLPVHGYEDFSESKLDIINRINRILGRVESSETPIEREDLYKLITKRLIRKVLIQEARDDVISEYVRLYQNKRSELPERIQNPVFYNKMKDSYPFHPELIDLLYDRWRSLPSFQGTRAILKILTRTLIHLYASKEKVNLILPSDINLNESNLKNDFLKHIDVKFASILNSDVLGFDSNATFLDKKYPNWNNFALGISQTIFLYSFAQEEIPRGLNLSELKLNLIRPGTTVSLLSEVLHRLHSTLSYLHFRDGRNFFSHESNLNHKIQDLKELFQDQFEEELRREIKKHVGKKLTTIIWPSCSNEIPDDQRLKIVLVHPSVKKNTLEDWLEKKGTSFRQNKNTIFFVLPHISHLTVLQDLIQTKLALIELHKKVKDEDLELRLEIKQRHERINETLAYHIRKTYSILYDGQRTISFSLPSVEYEPLTKWFHRELTARELIVTKLHYRKLKELFLSSNHCISTYQILEQFFVDLNLFKIESVEIIKQAICWGVKEGAFGRALLQGEGIQTSSFFFSVEIPPTQIMFTSNEFLINREIARTINNQIAQNPEIIEVIIPEERKNSASSSELIFKKTLETKDEADEIHSLSLEVQDLNSKSLLDFYRGVIEPLESNNADISIKIKLDVKSKKKIPETTINTTIKETISQLGAQITIIDEEE